MVREATQIRRHSSRDLSEDVEMWKQVKPAGLAPSRWGGGALCLRNGREAGEAGAQGADGDG